MFQFLRGRISVGATEAVGRERDGAGSRADFRRLLIDEIGGFLLSHDLELSAMNFEFARDVVSGHDVRLIAAMHQLLGSGGRLSDAAVQELVARTSPARLSPEALVRMLSEVEAQAETLLGLATRTRGDIDDYGSALRNETAGMADDTGGGVVARLVALTRGMLERTQAIEAEMHESHKQAKRLKRSLDKARHAADHDALTGLPNRRAFEARLAEAVTEAKRTGKPLAVAFCDIDHFKAINDGHGHATGDRVLCFVADLLMRASGNRCHVARHGGEEFVMLFPGMAPEQALVIVDAARASLGERRLVNRDNGASLPPVTFSAGITDVMAFADSAEALSAADAALYAAKQEGGDRVLLYRAV